MATTGSGGEDEAWIRDKRSSEGNGDVNTRYKREGGSFWSRRTLLEKILLGLIALFVLLLLVPLIVLLVNTHSRSSVSGSSSAGSSTQSAFSSPKIVSYEGTEICLSKDCVSAAARIDRHIDYDVKPCDDFYQFACGRWMKENAIPESESSLSTFYILRKEVEIVLRNLLQEDKNPDDLECIKKAKDLYASCLDLDYINKRGDQPMKDLLLRELGGWPITHPGWNEDQFDLVDLMIKANTFGKKPIILLYTGLDSKESSHRTLVIDQPGFGMPGQKYYQVPEDDKMLAAYKDLMLGIALLQGAKPETAKNEVDEIVHFETRLANISVPDEQRRDNNALYNPMTLAEIHANYSKIIDWKRYVVGLMSLPDIGVTDITDEEIIINQSPQYYTSLIEVLNSTPKRVVANYIMWRVAYGMTGTQGDSYLELLLNYRKVLFGTSTESARFRGCAQYATSNLGLAVGRMFIKDNFRVEAKTLALDMIKDLQAAFNELLDNLDWMDEDTKLVAKEKNDFISPKIGYPEQLLNDTYLEERYANMTYHRDKYFENVIENQRDYFYFGMRRLRQPMDKTKWDVEPSTVNAFYSPVRNQIMFPAGILQPPFFSETYPRSMNYGGIGYLIGHEISHGFDDEGRQYDKHGNLAQWWNDGAIKKFEEKAKCIIEQYGNFTVEDIGMQLNGINTQGENIADNGGLKQSYKAYRNWVKRHGREEPRLPGLSFSHDQLFFINFAQLWCDLMRDAIALNRIRIGVHSPPRFRVIGTAQNTPEFADAFNCPVGSYMNPKKKCKVW